MRAYYFTSQEIAMEHVLPERRMKLSLVHEMNDPFELLSAQLTERDVRKLSRTLHAHWTQTKGVICFSGLRMLSLKQITPFVFVQCACSVLDSFRTSPSVSWADSSSNGSFISCTKLSFIRRSGSTCSMAIFCEVK